MSAISLTVVLLVLSNVFMLVLSNVFMTFAWYAHLRNLADKPWILAALLSWASGSSSTSSRYQPTGSGSGGVSGTH